MTTSLLRTRHWLHNFVAGACLLALALPALAQARPDPALPPPALDVRLTPHARDGEVVRMDVELRIEHPDVAAGAALLRMPTLLVSTPTAAYAASQISASDAKGPLILRSEEEPETPTGNYRRYLTDRATTGDVVVRYATPPRAVDASTRNGPLFDLRRQPHGIMGAGVYFLALPDTTTPYRIGLRWDLSGMPAGSIGVWSLGEGEQHTVAPVEVLRFSYYAAGPLQRRSGQGHGKFAMYWLGKPPFEMSRLAEQTESVYRYMTHFFGADDAPYRVFARGNPYPAGGGTGLASSFMFGYGPGGETIAQGPQMLLAHEMAHNWPKLDDEEHALTAWYTEGTAEFYSIVLSQRAGVFGLDAFVDQLNDRASGYYANPHRALSNAEAGKLFWKDARAQRVPYGRGFMYLVGVDSQVRARSGGKRSLDDLVLEVLRRQRAGDKVGVADWRALVVGELGAAAGVAFDRMVAGDTLAPEPTAFGCLRAIAVRERPFDLGFDEMRLGQVNDLREGSAAAAAGLHDGDAIVSSTPLPTLKGDPRRHMQMQVRRDGKLLTFDYLPRGAEIDAWHWQRDPDSQAGCTP